MLKRTDFTYSYWWFEDKYRMDGRYKDVQSFHNPNLNHDIFPCMNPYMWLLMIHIKPSLWPSNLYAGKEKGC